MEEEHQHAERVDFDVFAENYDEALEQGISVSGESKDYFAEQRIAWLKCCLERLGVRPLQIVDFGCGTGSAIKYLLGLDRAAQVQGVEISSRSIEVARRDNPPDRTRFCFFRDYTQRDFFDLAFCNGVFHHIAPEDRKEALDRIFQSLKPGGLFAFWENNPWNPGTRIVMSRIPFDKDAQTLQPPEAKSLLGSCGFEVMRADYLFYFPKLLAFMRWLEPGLRSVPLGAQYQLLCRKPPTAGHQPESGSKEH